MTPQAAVIELLERVGVAREILISDYELSQWPSEAVSAMKSQKLIARARAGSSAVCPGCERECVMPVHTVPVVTGKPEPFIVCDKRSDINRVKVPTNRLTQWQCRVDTVCGFIMDSLGLRRNDKALDSVDLWGIGIAKGNKRTQMLCLQADNDGVLTLVAGGNTVPLADAIDFRDGAYLLDGATIRQLVDSASAVDSRYTPTNAKREARKLDTQTLYESWQKKYRSLKKTHPNKSDVWYSQQIAKLDIAKGRNANTIKKKMKL